MLGNSEKGGKYIALVLLIIVLYPSIVFGESSKTLETPAKWRYSFYLSMLKSAPAVEAGISRYISQKHRFGMDMIYGVGTNKGRNFSVMLTTFNLFYDMVNDGRFVWYVTAGAGGGFLELQRFSITVSRDSTLAYDFGTGFNYVLGRRFVVFPGETGFGEPQKRDISLSIDMRSIATTSSLPFSGGTTFGKLAIGISVEF